MNHMKEGSSMKIMKKKQYLQIPRYNLLVIELASWQKWWALLMESAAVLSVPSLFQFNVSQNVAA